MEIYLYVRTKLLSMAFFKKCLEYAIDNICKFPANTWSMEGKSVAASRICHLQAPNFGIFVRQRRQEKISDVIIRNINMFGFILLIMICNSCS